MENPSLACRRFPVHSCGGIAAARSQLLAAALRGLASQVGSDRMLCTIKRENAMCSGSLVFAQIMLLLPWDTFCRSVARIGWDRCVKALPCVDLYWCMAFAQSTHRSILRDIEAYLSLYPWARIRKTKGAVELHTQLDPQGNIPAFIPKSDGKLHDVNVLDMLVPEAGALYVMDRAYLDFECRQSLHLCSSFFVL